MFPPVYTALPLRQDFVESLKLGVLWQPHTDSWLNMGETNKFPGTREHHNSRKMLCFQGYFVRVLRFIFPNLFLLRTILRKQQGA